MTAEEDSKEIFFDAQRLNNECTVFQAELFGINMALDWIQNQRTRSPSYAIHVDSKAALMAIKDSQTTHPLAVSVRMKFADLINDTSITFHWVKGHAGLRGNERADYLAKIAASYKTNIAYNALPRFRGKQMLEEYYVKIWNATYTNSENASHTKSFIPTIYHRLSLSIWPNHIITQFLTNHGRFRSYLYKMNIISSPNCDCPENSIQTASHLLSECSLFQRERPAVLQSTPLPQALHHIHRVDITNFLQHLFSKLNG